MSNTQLIVGLGNPGAKYKNTRHNVGFMVIDTIVDDLRLDAPQKTKNYELWMWNPPSPKVIDSEAMSGLPAQTRRATEGQASDFVAKVLFVKPVTFMNDSGEAVAELVRFFKIADDDIMIVHDDIDLALGTLRLRQGGSSGGHNGLNSILQTLGHPDFKRVKIGVSRPPQHVPAERYVLQPFNSDEKETIAQVIDQTAKIVVQLASQTREFSDQTIRVEK